MIKLFSIICQKEKLIRAHCKYAKPTSSEEGEQLSTDTTTFAFIFAELAGRGGRTTERGLPVFA